MEDAIGTGGAPFSLAQGRAAGLSDARMRRVEFARPFHGVRVARRSDDGLVERCAALRVAIDPRAVFSHVTAARLWGMPLPARVGDDLHVLAPGAAEVRRPGVVGWRRTTAPTVAIRHGLPVTPAADTWATLATLTPSRGGRCTREWLVAIGDFLVSGERVRYGRAAPLADHDTLADAVARHGSRRGAVALRWALERIRTPVDSPPETFLRLALVDAGLPEPAVQPSIRTAVGTRHPDLGYLKERVLLEYLGDVHRTDRATWLQDLERVRLFQDAGYRVVLVGGRDLTPSGSRTLTAHVRDLLALPRAHESR